MKSNPTDILSDQSLNKWENMSEESHPIDRKRMADGTVKPASTRTLHVATKPVADPAPPLSSASASASTTAVAKPKLKPAFRPAKDDTKPTLRDPISRSDPIVTEQAMLRLPPFPRSFTQF